MSNLSALKTRVTDAKWEVEGAQDYLDEIRQDIDKEKQKAKPDQNRLLDLRMEEDAAEDKVQQAIDALNVAEREYELAELAARK